MTIQDGSPSSPSPNPLGGDWPRRWPLWATLLVAISVFIPLAASLGDYGLVIDEATYVWAAAECRAWFAELSDKGLDSFSNEGIARRWHFLEPLFSRPAHEHSNFNLPVAVHVMNASWLAFHAFVDELVAYRLGSAILFSITLAAVAHVVGKERGPVAGAASALGVALTPRVFAHAHFAATDTPLACFWTLALVALFRLSAAQDNRQYWMRVAVFGVIAGLAMAVKLTGWLLWGPVAIWLAIYRPQRWFRSAVIGGIISLIVVVIVTPNLWSSPIGGLIDYIQQAAANPWRITVYCFGECTREGIPRILGPLIVAVTTPIAILAFSLVGFALSWRNRLISLFALNAAFMLGWKVAGKIPHHDVERQFLPYFYFAGIAAGFGFDEFVRFLGWMRRRLQSQQHGLRAVAVALVALAALAEPLIDGWIYRRHGLCYYNRAVGGLEGAVRMGFEVSYWYETATDDIWRRMVAKLPRGARVFMRPDHPGIDYLTKRGIWREDLRIASPGDAEYRLLYAHRAAYCIDDKEAGGQVLTELAVFQQYARAIDVVEFRGIRLLGLFHDR